MSSANGLTIPTNIVESAGASSPAKAKVYIKVAGLPGLLSQSAFDPWSLVSVLN